MGKTLPLKKNKRRESVPAARAPEVLHVGERLRLARMACGLRMRQVAQLVDCSVSLISKYESDSAIPSLSTLHKIVAALGTNISALFDPPDSATGIVSRARDR